jgi:penicillin-binding protein 2
LAAQILGYTGEVDTKDIKSDATKQLQLGDYIGKMGIERTYDAELRGANGAGYVEVDAMGRRRKAEGSEKLLGFVAQTDPVPGNNIYLTIDLDLQKVALQAMKNRKFSGSVVAVDPQNGEILAMINTPSYDPGTISGREVNSKIWSELRENKDRPLRNRAIQDHYPPGSTFKLLVAVAALSEKVVNLNTTFNCHGGINFGKRRFNCHRTHGVVDFYKAIRESCDVYFYNLGLQLGVDTIAKYARLFGLGSATGLKLGYEQKGLIPDSQWKLKFFKEPWQPGETLSVAIGQGYVATTPMQLVSAFASLGNGGFVYHPYLVKKIENRNGEAIKEFKPELMRKIEVSQEVFDAVKEGLSQVVNAPHGTATSIRSPKILISGKTGTAQVRQFADITKIKRCDALDYNHRHHGWFVGYAPKSNPIIAVVAIAEHGCHGASAAPIVKEVIEAYQEKLGLVGDEKILEEIKEERKKYPSIAVHKESVEDE